MATDTGKFRPAMQLYRVGNDSQKLIFYKIIYETVFRFNEFPLNRIKFEYSTLYWPAIDLEGAQLDGSVGCCASKIKLWSVNLNSVAFVGTGHICIGVRGV